MATPSPNPKRPEVDTTSFSILGLLAIRPFSTYELAKLMDRTLGRAWPRARSKLYKEPKVLVAHGLARANKEPVGRRPRTVYEITPAGRRALAGWLGRPSEPLRVEFEPLLKVFFADHGTTTDLRATLAQVRAWADEQMDEHIGVARAYGAGLGPFQGRAAVLALSGRFLAELTDTVGRWAAWAEEVTATWPDDPSQAEPHWPVFEEYAARPTSEERAGDRPSGYAPWRISSTSPSATS